MSVYGGGLFSFFSGQKKYNGGNNTEICMYNYTNYGNSCWFASYIQFLKSTPFFYESFMNFLTKQKGNKDNSSIKIKVPSPSGNNYEDIEDFNHIYNFIQTIFNDFTCSDNKINKDLMISLKDIYSNIDQSYAENPNQQYDAFLIYKCIFILYKKKLVTCLRQRLANVSERLPKK
jgi:hypothetical protein